MFFFLSLFSFGFFKWLFSGGFLLVFLYFVDFKPLTILVAIMVRISLISKESPGRLKHWNITPVKYKILQKSVKITSAELVLPYMYIESNFVRFDLIWLSTICGQKLPIFRLYVKKKISVLISCIIHAFKWFL